MIKQFSNFRNLIVWQEAKNLTLIIYRATKHFPKDEIYGITSQMKRCTISVASNIAEGNQRKTHKDRLRFFNIAYSSLVELDNQLEISLELKFISKQDYKKILEKINKVGYLLLRFTKAQNPTNPSYPTRPTNRTNPSYPTHPTNRTNRTNRTNPISS